MKETKEILKSWNIEATPRLLAALHEAQRDAWNEAILDSASVAKRFNDFYESAGSGGAINRAILKLKK